jgi:hypothetical protein
LGADRFNGAQEHALNAVAQARADGFQVAEDLSVTLLEDYGVAVIRGKAAAAP